MLNKSLNIFAEKMNYILYKLILCILGYMFWNNTRQMLQKTQVIQIQNDWRYNTYTANFWVIKNLVLGS